MKVFDYFVSYGGKKIIKDMSVKPSSLRGRGRVPVRIYDLPHCLRFVCCIVNKIIMGSFLGVGYRLSILKFIVTDHVFGDQNWILFVHET